MFETEDDSDHNDMRLSSYDTLRLERYVKLVELMQKVNTRSMVSRILHPSENRDFGAEYECWVLETERQLKDFAKAYRKQVEADPALKIPEHNIIMDKEFFVKETLANIRQESIAEFASECERSSVPETRFTSGKERAEDVMNQLERFQSKFDKRCQEAINRNIPSDGKNR